MDTDLLIRAAACAAVALLAFGINLKAPPGVLAVLTYLLLIAGLLGATAYVAAALLQ